MNTAHEQLSQIARAGAGRFASTALASGHAGVTRRVRRHRTARAAATSVAGIGVIGGSVWGLDAFRIGDALAPGASATAQHTLPAPTPSLQSPIALPSGTSLHTGAGSTVERLAEYLAGPFDVSVDDAKAALAAAVADQVPEATTDEGWFLPGDYSLDNVTLRDVADQMVAARVQQLTELGVARADWQTVLTEASLVQAEAHLASDMPKVARVIQNRLAQDLTLQLDSTVRFAAPGDDSDSTTDEQRATDSPFNTYLYQGLPPGAIDSPSAEAVNAVLAPAEGDWLYFVTVNLDTGETAFASTFEEHQANVTLLQEWIAAQPAG